ncbi:MAG: hypothetical protein QN784_01440, partial [Nitrososphaeraceae archaeon]|nr:hypothetical protein [Nitrososphaeraceae archaeon]MDW0241307.1 hypothetical protein [Nitrososphaeraceae archaeon]MDW0297097.1 hypothetical protein [Nitrososphaeraceae archaeon]MDW0340378.1 hypothetical protein [Nitrososphaeraceae archaeon]MDW3667271.1 hypothetical protein [Nitrososphaeraceae archaeon]
ICSEKLYDNVCIIDHLLPVKRNKWRNNTEWSTQDLGDCISITTPRIDLVRTFRLAGHTS